MAHLHHDLEKLERRLVNTREHGLLTRPIRDTIVLMPPLCITAPELRRAITALATAIPTAEPMHR